MMALTISTERKQNPLAVKVLEKVGGYELSLKKPNCDIGEDGKEDSEKLVAEYYILRTVLVSASFHIFDPCRNLRPGMAPGST